MKDDKRNKLPGFLARIAGEQGIDADSIIAFGRGDLNAQCAYKDTYSWRIKALCISFICRMLLNPVFSEDTLNAESAAAGLCSKRKRGAH